MPRYFFHYNNGTSHTDTEGVELASDHEAWEYGTGFCASLVRTIGRKMPTGEEYRLECVAEDGRGVFAINWSAVVLMQDS